MVTVAIENKRGAWRQLLEAMDDSHGFVSPESSLQLFVDVQFDLVAVLASFAGSIDVEDRGIQGRREGRGQALSQAVQRPFSSDACSQDQTDWLCGLGCLEVPLQVDPAPVPELNTLVGELSLHFFQLPEEDVYLPHIVYVRWSLMLEEILHQDGKHCHYSHCYQVSFSSYGEKIHS